MTYPFALPGRIGACLIPSSQDESMEDYAGYYGHLMDSTKSMPSLALVLAAEDIEFRKVIGLTEQ